MGVQARFAATQIVANRLTNDAAIAYLNYIANFYVKNKGVDASHRVTIEGDELIIEVDSKELGRETVRHKI